MPRESPMPSSKTLVFVASLASIAGLALGGCSSESDAVDFGAGGGDAATSSVATTSSSSAATSSTSSTGNGGSGGEGGQMPTNNGFPAAWPDGLSCGSEPDVTVWEYDSDTFILRQSLCTNFEGPFLYLLFGEDRALLEDTGTGDVNVANVVQGIIDDWLQRKGKSSVELIVSHSHGHGDHVGGDGQFSGKPDTTVVGKGTSSVQDFFGIQSWPDQIVTYDLGARVIDVIPIPGHQSAHIAYYDRRQKLLLTGDTLYPGRLYIENWNDYVASIGRLVDFVEAGSPVSWVLGTHIEMKAAGGDYAFGANKHAGEHALELSYDVLLELNDAVQAMGGSPQYEEHADFIIYPL